MYIYMIDYIEEKGSIFSSKKSKVKKERGKQKERRKRFFSFEFLP